MKLFYRVEYKSSYWNFSCIIYLILTFRCNKGFNLGDFILAICCAPFYIVYKIANQIIAILNHFNI